MLTFKLYGNIATDPKIRRVGENGREVLDLRVASNPPGSDRTDFFNVTIWSDRQSGQLPAELAGWCKGHRVELTGQATSSNWHDQSGNYREAVTFHPTKYHNVTLEPAGSDVAAEHTHAAHAAANPTWAPPSAPPNHHPPAHAASASA